MKFFYKFSNLLGTVYRCGNVCFTPDGNSVITPVGNRITIHDLKNNKTKTLSPESRYNYTIIALSPNGNLLIAVNEQGKADVISLVSCCVIQGHKFPGRVQSLQFSPNGEYFAVGQAHLIRIYKVPGELTGEYNPFVIVRTYLATYDDITWIEWSSDSRFLAVGCRDSSTKIIAIKFLKNFRTFIVSGHSEPIVGCFFDHGNLNLNTLSKDGRLTLWECSLGFTDIYETEKVQDSDQSKRAKESEVDDESDDDVEESVERKTDKTDVDEDENDMPDGDAKKSHPFKYKKLSRHFLADIPRKESISAHVTAASYNRKIRTMVVAFSTGSFYMYELPDVNMIHSLSISDYAINAACFNPSGAWLALASAGLGQLLVWEWQSEQYVMKQQGHSSEMCCISYSPDGQHIATGGEDAKVKLWNTLNGFCFVTFSEHTSAISAVQFSTNKKFLVSSSLDGTVRAFDLARYRNFRTFTSPRPVQFACVAIDHAGELIVAGGQDVFEIYLWSMKLGTLLEILSGHEGPVISIAFSPVATSSTLVSGSWDKTIKIWNCLESNSGFETIDMLSDVICVAFRPNGEEVAVATLNGNISVFDVKTSHQITSIEGRKDLGSGRCDTDVITAKKNLKGAYFSSIEYSANGECILAGGKSQFICIYHIGEGILLKKFEITQNHSFDGLSDFINRRKMTEFGNAALIEKREQLEGGNVTIRLPGVQKGDMASRSYSLQVRVFSVRFSPTGQAWAAACTEGLLIYSLDDGMVFDPFDLSIEVTPKACIESVKRKEYSKALIMALKLNEPKIITAVIENIPSKEIDLVCSYLPNEYAERILKSVTRLVRQSQHIEFYLKWSCVLLTEHGNKNYVFQGHTLLSLHESLSRKYNVLNKLCDYNKYTLNTLTQMGEKQSLPSAANGTHNTYMDIDDNMILVSTNNNLEKEIASDFEGEADATSSDEE